MDTDIPDRHPIRHNRPVSDKLHPHIYRVMVGLALWLVLSAWALFGGPGDANESLMFVSVLFVMAIAVPAALWLVWRRHGEDAITRGNRQSLHDWLHGDFQAWQGRLSGAEAAAQILLPLAAVAFGITAFGVVLHLA
jgi:hypothetical protein